MPLPHSLQFIFPLSSVPLAALMPQRVMRLVIRPHKKFPLARTATARPVTDKLRSNSLAALATSTLESDRARACGPGPPHLTLWALPESFHHVSSSSKSSSVGTSSSFSSVLLALLGQLPSSSRPSIPSLQITKVISITLLKVARFSQSLGKGLYVVSEAFQLCGAVLASPMVLNRFRQYPRASFFRP